MSSSQAGSSSAGAGGDSPNVDNLSEGVANVHLDSAHDNGGEWEVYAKKFKNRNGSSAARPWVSPNPNSRAWGQPDFPQQQGLRTYNRSGLASGNTLSARAADMRKPAARGRGFCPPANMPDQGNFISQPAIGAPLEHG
ncbi:hypothetical protein MLD38_028389 [Melastoma candidum]|uniref:Uncharacterized protein n=1 Tax=Melastoma candidum TaxID=119954 RepID=A0ACB9N1G0_9MYRT|nr:hypothetical protein MLD38_028389 [Melastoma candidum]